MRAWKIKYACLTISFWIATGCLASAQVVSLACGGTYHVYPLEEPMEGTVAPTASSVVLADKRINTSLGEYRISSVDGEQIFFDKQPATPALNFVTHGGLDRVTGKMMIGGCARTMMAKKKPCGRCIWLFTCSAAKRLI
jgi:hypothetical protein